jgi:hypothetical protein
VVAEAFETLAGTEHALDVALETSRLSRQLIGVLNVSKNMLRWHVIAVSIQGM